MPYHIKNKNSKKAMKKVRKSPLPLGLMKNDITGSELFRGKNNDNHIESTDNESAKNVDNDEGYTWEGNEES